ncbi:MAG TPA: DUF6152 family protein [Bryobacteraceae bacterium]|jgi:hypothetical protein|nr:DUF6152 family protein [Bryobacteraceae bacterium]
MKKQSKRNRIVGGLLAVGSLGLSVPALAHHSFAMYDQSKTLVLTGVATQFVAQANHAELHFYLVGPDGKLVKDKDGKYQDWGVEMAGAAAVAQQGITADSFPVGTIFSVKMNPLRDGSPYGSRAGGTAIAKCPPKTPPAAGMTCDTVKGSELLGAARF